jgi:hypothetical protein
MALCLEDSTVDVGGSFERKAFTSAFVAQGGLAEEGVDIGASQKERRKREGAGKESLCGVCFVGVELGARMCGD